MKKLFNSIIFLFLSFILNFSYAFTVKFKCENCKEAIDVPLAASNSYIPTYFWLVFIIPVVWVSFDILTNLIRKKQVEMKYYILLLVSGVFLSIFPISSYFDNIQKEDFSGKYAVNDKSISFVVVNGILINEETKQELELIGKYIYDKQSKSYFIKENGSYYSVSFDKNSVYKMNKIS